MLDFDAICRGRTPSWIWSVILLSTRVGLIRSVIDEFRVHFECIFWHWKVNFECYLWCSRALGYFIGCLRCLVLMLFVVAGGTSRSPCFSSMLAIVCLVKRYCRMLWLELQLQYLVCLPSILDFDGCFFVFLSWFLGRIQQMCERNYVRFVNDFRLMLVWFWIVLDCFD